MIKKNSFGMLMIIGILCMGLFHGCGAGDSSSGGGTTSTLTTTTVGPTTPIPASIDLLVSNSQLDSDMDGAPTVTLTAIVKDSSNRTLKDVVVSFTADSGSLTIANEGKTGDNGTATATLGSGGNPTNRTINLTASVSGVTPATNTVTVTGTNLSISGSTSLSFGDSTSLTIFLKDSKGKGISGKTVTVKSTTGNTLSPAAPYVTDTAGQVIVTVKAAVGGADKITASAIGATKEFNLMVNAAILAFVTPPPPPAAVTEIPIGTNQPVTVFYTIGGTAQAGVTVNFNSTLGTLSSPSAVTGANGQATVTVSSTQSGPADLSASIPGGPSSQLAIEFVSTTASSVSLQASPAVIGTNSGGLETEKSLLTAVVRDASNNLVKNKTINFTRVTDASGGRLSPPSTITDSSGTANSYFISGASISGLDGVTIRASVADTAVTTTTTLTVAKKALFITLNTGPYIKEMTDHIRYQKDYVALVTDGSGKPVEGATVVATVTPMYYMKGYMNWVGGSTLRWAPVYTLQAASSTRPDVPACANEDGMTHNPLFDFNGVLDVGEDQNGNNRLDPGNIASVTSTVTDSTGHGTLSIVYAKDYAYWVNVKLEAFASTAGSTASAFETFDLPGLAVEYTTASTDPPGNPSPFGTSTTCFVDLTVTPVSSTQMTATWQKSPTAVSYNVYRGGTLLRNVTTNTMTDTGLIGNTQYCYQVKTVNAVGAETSFTDIVCNSTSAASLPAPTGVTATALSSSQVQISWSAVPGAGAYALYKDAAITPFKSVSSTSYIDAGLTANTLYCYAVSAYNSAGVESAKSSQVCAATQLPAPPTPANLTATGVVAGVGPPKTYKVTLSWNASADAAVYRLYRNGGATPALSVPAPTVTVDDTTAEALTTYCYTITAMDVSGNESAQSAPVCTATPP